MLKTNNNNQNDQTFESEEKIFLLHYVGITGNIKGFCPKIF